MMAGATGGFSWPEPPRAASAFSTLVERGERGDLLLDHGGQFEIEGFLVVVALVVVGERRQLVAVFRQFSLRILDAL